MYIRKILLLVVLGGLVFAGIFAYKVYDALFDPNTAFEDDEYLVHIPTGARMVELDSIMEPVLEDWESFERAADRKQYTSNIKAGRYRLTRGMNNNSIINTLRSRNLPLQLSFNNQESLASLAGRVSEQIEADSLSLLAALSDRTFLEEHGFNVETALALYIPNSYEFFWNTSAEEFRERMLKEYHRFWTDARQAKASGLGLTPIEVASLAAVVHKETAKVDERPRVAGVYLNRLKRNMPLQADPTVIYAIKRESGNFDTIIKRVLYRDLTLDSPYNTYKYAGVPPGPITMPDITAVDAVLNAEKHNYLYFVANVEKFGYHTFAETLVQHNRNKAQYIRWINSQNIRR